MSEVQTQSLVTPPTGLELSTLTDDEVIAFTRGVRVRVVNDLFKAGAVSGDNSDRNLLANMLNGLDSQAISSKRIVAEQKTTDTSAVVIAALLANLDKTKIFTASAADQNIIDVESRVIPNTIPNPIMLPGEMDVDSPQMDYLSFVKSQGKDADSLGRNATHVEAVEDDTP